MNPSEQAEMWPARAGTRRASSSLSVRVVRSAATRAPPDVPVITSGRRFSSRRARATPK